MAQRLRAGYQRPEQFREEYERNIAKGGIQLGAPEPAELREAVEVELALEFAGESLVLEGEVVHCAPGSGAGAAYSLAVQFFDPAPELRDRLARHAEAAGAGAEPPEGSPGDAPWDVDPSAIDLEEEALELEPEAAPSSGADLPERRSAPRGAGRVPARVEAPAEQVGGHTRDLSESGALLAVDGSAVPVGGRVRLELVDPEGGPPLEVEGSVARHVEAEGTVAAVAVRFDPEPEERSRLAAFVEATKRRERQRREGGIAGPLEELGVVNLLQMLGKSAPLGTLTLKSGAEEGVVAFEAGRLRYARLGPLRGRKALARLLAWERGRFEFHAAVDPLPGGEAEDETEPLDAALLEAMRQLDEVGRSEAPPPPPATRFRLDRDALARKGVEGTTEEALCDLAGAGFSLRRMLDVIPEPDAEVLAALAALEARGILAPDEGEGSGP